MPSPPTVFLSHSTQDHEIANAIRTSLERSGISCWISSRDILQGKAFEDAIVQAIEGSKVVLCLLTANANESKHVEREIHYASEVAHGKIIVPVRLEDIHPKDTLAYYLSRLQWIDATTRPIDRHLWTIVDRITAVLAAAQAEAPPSPAGNVPPDKEHIPAAGSPAQARPGNGAVKAQKVALLYKRSAQPDNQVLAALESGLRESGHNVFVDRHLHIGVEWAKEIERQVREADAVIPLLSDASVQSEMLSMELQIASESAQGRFGKPRILPVRIGSEAPLPEPFLSIVGRLQYALWRDSADDQRLLKDLLDGLEAKEQPKVAKSEMPGGAVPLDSSYYIVQPTDIEFYEGLQRQDGLLLVKGARQMGKTSLLARGLKQAREAGKTVVLLDLQMLNLEDLKDLTSLYKALGGMIADQLKLDVCPEDKWRPGRAPNPNFENYIVREVMGKIEGHVVIAMDEVDRLFSYPFASEIFGMFRSWFNARSTNPDMPWGRLTQAFVYATEPNLFITDQFQSPFNVGTKLELHDFNIDQVGRLNELYERPIRSAGDLEKFYALFRGHPYLSRRGFYELTRRPNAMTFDRLLSESDVDEGPFGDHLRRILVMLARDKRTLDVVTGLVHRQPVPDLKSFYALRSGGLISGHSPEDAHFRCGIYESYLARHLA